MCGFLSFKMRCLCTILNQARANISATTMQAVVAAIMPRDGGVEGQQPYRDIGHAGQLQIISKFDSAYLPLHFPLLFAWGDLGYQLCPYAPFNGASGQFRSVHADTMGSHISSLTADDRPMWPCQVILTSHKLAPYMHVHSFLHYRLRLIQLAHKLSI